ncbi:MAG: transcription elongation GreA/GreB family factor [Candidatus Promineifilaceae bacterium]|jgi:transcription elongation GreA/GreB family factor
MTDAIDFKGAAAGEIDNWLLSALDQEILPVSDFLELLAVRFGKGEIDKCNEWADLIQDTLAERKLGENLIALLRLRVEWQPKSNDLKAAYKALLNKVIIDRLQLTCVEGAFEGPQSTIESFKRLDTLVRLKAGAYCVDNTWGFGIVKRLDDFYKKVTIDFLKKANHQMSFAYAGETLNAIDSEHLLARRQDDPAEMERITKEEPHTLIRITLSSYGDLTVTQVQERLAEEGFVDDAKWKSFWDAARRGLKNDAHVEVPAKRSEPLRLLAKAKAYDAEWFANFALERDAKGIYALIEELEREGVTKALDDNSREVVGGRFAFAILGAEDADPTLCLKIILQANRLGFTGAEEGSYVRPQVIAAHLAELGRFMPAVAGLSARDLLLFFTLLSEYEFTELPELLLSNIAEMPVQLLDESMAFLMSAGHEEQAKAGIQKLFAMKSAPPQVLYWLCMHLDVYREWGFGQISDLYLQVITCFESHATHYRLRAQKLMKGLFQDRDWLAVSLELIDAKARAHLMVRVRNARGWEEASRRSVMGKMIKLYPELEKSASDKSVRKDTKPKGRFTSWRTYKQRQEQLKEITDVGIPENSKDIGVAISYGDLRENFEYQAAKDKQGLLMRRKAELERDLAEVRGTDFADSRDGIGGRGTVVAYSTPDGATMTMTILGEWDRDEERSIVSSESELAKRLTGKKAGDTVELPVNEQGALCTVVSVSAISAEIKAWAMGD